MTPTKVSNCCGVTGNKNCGIFSNEPNEGPTFQDLDICPECQEPCEYVLPDDRFRETDDLPEGLFTSND